MRRFGLLLLIAAAAAGQDAARWWSYVEFLANPALEGRNTGSEGHRKAADFVAAQFERDGLKPAGVEGYIQPVKFDTLQLDEPNSRLVLVARDKTRPIQLGDEAIIAARNYAQSFGPQSFGPESSGPEPSIDAPLVFVGHGLSIPEAKYDDFAGLETKGRIAVYLAGAPPNVPAALASHYQSAAERQKMLKAAGVIGTIAIANPKHMDIPWDRTAANRGQMAMQLAAAPGASDSGATRIAVAWNPAKADDLLDGTGHTFDELVADAEAGRPLPRFPIDAHLRATAAVKRGHVESQNIAAVYPGTDPVLKNEYIVMSAHVDHLGPGFNGAMDNAAGVATVLDTAATLKETHAQVRRSILFLVVTGEEKGLLGSHYFADNPTVPAKSIVADINTDMFLPLFPLKRITVYGLDESTLGDDARAVAKTSGVEVQLDPDPERNSFIRSDQYSFILRGIPALAMKDGYVKGTPEEKIFKTWLTERYHGKADDLSQPVDKQAAAEFDQFVAHLLVRVANADAKPAWKASSFFRRYAEK